MIDLILIIIEVMLDFLIFLPNRDQGEPVLTVEGILFLSFFLPLFLVMVLAGVMR